MVWAKPMSAFIGVLVLLCIPAVSQDSTTLSADNIWSELATGNRRFMTWKMAHHDLQERGRL